MGLALDESTENLEKLESNGIEAYIDPNLKTFVITDGGTVQVAHTLVNWSPY